MSVIDSLLSNWWIIFLLFTLLYPRLRQSAIERARQSALSSLGKKRGTNVITLIHRQETISFLGIPISRYIDIDDSEAVLRAVRLTDRGSPIDIIIHTPGGIALAATQIAFALKAHGGHKTVFVPHYAMSGGTLIALAADEIVMDPNAVLGPVDPQLGDQQGTYAASSILKVISRKKAEDIDDRTMYLAEESGKAIEQMRDTVRRLIGDRFSEEQADRIVEELVSGKYTHDFPITADTVCELLGQCASKELPREIYELMNLYRMETRRSPGVEYAPLR